MYFKRENGNLVKMPFQSGITVSIKATIALYKELKSEGLPYLLTTRVNQDCLESTFGGVRYINGGNTHPSPGEFINTMRRLCVSKNVEFLINSNVECYDRDEFISVDILDRVGFAKCENKENSIVKFSSESSAIRQYSEFHARNLVIGFIGKKLGLKPTMHPVGDSWIGLKGKGKLFEPTEDLIEICEKLDSEFNDFHGEGLKLCKDPMNTLCINIAKKYPTFPFTIIKLYTKVKFYARLKHLNMDVKMKSFNKSVRWYKQTGQFVN